MPAKPAMTLERARTEYVHRYTMEHKPIWARAQAPNGKYYAPQYKTDAEWFALTLFPPHPFSESVRDTSCYSSEQTWPLGGWLDAPFKIGGVGHVATK